MKYSLIENRNGYVSCVGTFDSLEDFVMRKISKKFYPLIEKIDYALIGETFGEENIKTSVSSYSFKYVCGNYKKYVENISKIYTKYYLKCEDGSIFKPVKKRAFRNWTDTTYILHDMCVLIEEDGCIVEKKKKFEHTYKFRVDSGTERGWSSGNRSSWFKRQKLTLINQEMKNNITAKELGFKVRSGRNFTNTWDLVDWKECSLSKSWKRRKVSKQWMCNKMEQNMKCKFHWINNKKSLKIAAYSEVNKQIYTETKFTGRY